MKVLHISTTDITGGAARAALRLHRGLKGTGVDSRMLVQTRAGDDPEVFGPLTRAGRTLALFRPTLDALPLSLYRGRKKNPFSTAMVPGCVGRRVGPLNPDIVHLHWVCGGFLRVETLRRFKRPIVWTLHDSWAFTGGCHLPFDCTAYEDSCGSCPELGSTKERDLSRRLWERKKKAWQGLDITVVTPSRWLAGCAGASSLFSGRRIEVIPNGLDIGRFKPMDPGQVREILGLPADKRLITFGAMWSTTDLNKGYHLLMEALAGVSDDSFKKGTELVVFGASGPAAPGGRAGLGDPDLKVHYLGELKDEITMAMLYAASDVFVFPSTHENLPNTIMEALASGTPVVAFDVGGIPDMVEHKKNGYLAKSFDTGDLARGIKWVLEDPKRHKGLCARARDKAEREYSLKLQAERYIALYEDVLKR